MFLSHLSQEIRVYKFGTPSGTISASHLFLQFQNQSTHQKRWLPRRFNPFPRREAKARAPPSQVEILLGSSPGARPRRYPQLNMLLPYRLKSRRKMFIEGANRLSIWTHWGKRRIPLGRMRETLGVKGGVFRVQKIRENAHSRLFQTLTRAQAHTMDPRLTINRRSLPRHP